jgi:5'-deoxynucleotidase YfbR-like HD superfamily hydrolase
VAEAPHQMITKAELLDVGEVKRYHATDVTPETLAHHMWGVAIICLVVWPDHHDLLKAALLHDAHERIVGDMPSPAKLLSSDFKRAYETLEAMVDGDIRRVLGTDIFPALDDQDQIRLRAADIGHLVLYSYRDMLTGNKLAKKTYEKGRQYLNSLLYRERELLSPLAEYFDSRFFYLRDTYGPA